MKTISLLLLALMPVIFGAASAADTAKAGRDADMKRFLTAIDFAGTLKKGLETLSAEERADPMVKAITSLPDERILSAAAPILSVQVTAEQAKEMADFYSSEFMQKVGLQVSANLEKPDQAYVVTPAQKAEYDAFMASDTGKAVIHIVQQIQAADFQEKFGAALDKELQGQKR
jgi:hypothetical protein